MRKPTLVAASLVVLLAVSACGRIGGAGDAPAAALDAAGKARRLIEQEAATPGVAAEQVLGLVKAAPGITAVPDDLVVPVAAALEDGPTAGYDGCLAGEAETTGQECVYGDPAGARTVVLFGDSHAGMWQPAFDAAGRRTHTRVVLLAKPACAVPELHFWLETEQRPNTECDDYRAWALGEIARVKPDTVVMTSLFTGPRDFGKKDISQQQWEQGLARTIAKVNATGAQAVVLGDMAYLEQSAPECLAAHDSDVAACARPASEAVLSAHNAGEAAATEKAGGRYVGISDWFCTDVCEPIIGRMVVYQNQYHISAAYSRHLSKVVADAVGMTA
ncbi:SGNH hydrolase domain-containing protein [Spirilliplanes yamanashiensis]|uniref:SGNH domain-containing protein n=1 Tax=Spirilliplanes yamanashiensis TaxID=42233 RepID=A0A8J3Y9P4_9ACTN|nr:SGNH hydrolase domain-containing protein [Spirilliplanes yamanashiensis]MDP9815685.1 hypothetical protein [Spirilliplanes yamanashiensis]GIJ03939.1 hypothetical protein Sya03_32910 [Spirilliplanes yamanashiensis]